MMKKVLSIISIVFILAATAGVMMTSAASGPNRGWLLRYTPTASQSTGYVENQPAYYEPGYGHAMQGRVRVILQDSDANISYTGYSYTTEATYNTDTTVYQASRVGTVPDGGTSMVQYAFKWSIGGTWQTGIETTE